MNISKIKSALNNISETVSIAKSIYTYGNSVQRAAVAAEKSMRTKSLSDKYFDECEVELQKAHEALAEIEPNIKINIAAIVEEFARFRIEVKDALKDTIKHPTKVTQLPVRLSAAYLEYMERYALSM